jgi:hypothetical protein
MSDIDLPQEEADNLILMPKQRANDEVSYFPSGGSSLNIPLISEDRQESFFLDIYRGRIDLSKIKFQNRSKQIVVLLRLDLNGSPHRNPDNEEISCPHLHIYKEGYGTKWAYPVPSNFTNLIDSWQTLQEFMDYCNITKPPEIQRGLE